MSQIPYRSFLLRLRKIATIALQEYHLGQVDLKFVTFSGNCLYRVTVPPGNLIPPGRYALRLHQPNYMRSDYIASEMEWLSALQEEGIAVPKPYRNQNGDWVTCIDGGYEVPQKRVCTLLEWVDGRNIGTKGKAHHFKSLGRIMGTMHEQAKRWKIPKGFTRPHWDWEGLYGEGFSYGVPAADARAAIPMKYQPIFNETLKRVREVSEQLGKKKDVYGLIHADLGLADNVMFNKGEAKPFDFDDCGFGYWVFDYAIPLVDYFIDVSQDTTSWERALRSGYEETSSLDDIGIEFLDLFIAARFAQFMFFFQASGLAHPQLMDDAKAEVEKHAKYLKYILKRLN